MVPPVHVILNPAAGGGAGRRVRPELERELSFLRMPYTLEETTGPGHAVSLAAAAAAAGARTVLCVGGDGTVHEVANGLLRAAADGAEPPVLGIVPIGTGNDLVKVVIGGTDRRRAYDVLAAGEVRRIDVGRVEWEGGGEYFVNAAGTGIDVEVVRQMRRLPRMPGALSYLVALLRALVRFRPIPLHLTLDGERIDRKAMIAAICNGCCLGGGFYICPAAVPDDGSFDLCIVHELNLWQIARVLPRILRGTHTGMREVTMRRAKTVELTAAGTTPLFFQLDGELREPPNARTLRLSLERAALPVLTARPKATPGADRVPDEAAAGAAPRDGSVA